MKLLSALFQTACCLLLLLPFYGYGQTDYLIREKGRGLFSIDLDNASFKFKSTSRFTVFNDSVGTPGFITIYYDKNEDYYTLKKDTVTFFKNEKPSGVYHYHDAGLNSNRPTKEFYLSQKKRMNHVVLMRVSANTGMVSCDRTAGFDAINVDMGSFVVNHVWNSKLWLNSCKIDHLMAFNSDSATFVFAYCNIRDYEFFYTTIQNPIYFSGSEFPDTLSFSDVSFGNLLPSLNLTGFKNSDGHTCVLKLENTDVSRLKFNYYYYSLDTAFDNRQSGGRTQIYEDYTKILEIQNKYGYTNGAEKASKELKAFLYTSEGHWLINWIDKNWWDYGYNKNLIVRNSLLIMLVFFVFNFVGYRKLVYETYTIGEFVEADRRARTSTSGDLKKFFRKIIYCFLYTGYVFWGFKLDVEKISLKNTGLAVYIIFQYLSGIVCLAYLANYILSK